MFAKPNTKRDIKTSRSTIKLITLNFKEGRTTKSKKNVVFLLQKANRLEKVRQRKENPIYRLKFCRTFVCEFACFHFNMLSKNNTLQNQ
jgi:hypothetical protein